MAAGASDSIFRSIYEGCIRGSDIIIERRPYHRNCGCALHDKSIRRKCPHGSPKSSNLSYPIKRVWHEGCLSLDAASPSPPSSHIHATMKQRRKEDDNDDKYMAITAMPWKRMWKGQWMHFRPAFYLYPQDKNRSQGEFYLFMSNGKIE